VNIRSLLRVAALPLAE